jgi:hypothetical protein
MRDADGDEMCRLCVHRFPLYAQLQFACTRATR